MKEHILIFYGEKDSTFPPNYLCNFKRADSVKCKICLKVLFHIVNGGGPVPVEGDISVQNAFSKFPPGVPVLGLLHFFMVSVLVSKKLTLEKSLETSP